MGDISAVNDGIVLSVIVVTHDRVASLERCLNFVFGSTLPERSEVIIIVNGKSKDTLELLSKYSSEHPQLKYYPIDRTTFGGTRNFGIDKSSGEILYFIDDDVTVEPDLFVKAVRKFEEHPEVGVIGGPNITPPGSSWFQRCSGYVLETYFGAAEMRYRYRPIGADRLSNERKLILCNLAVRSSALREMNLRFNDKVVSNEENILLQQVKYHGYGMLYSPELIVYHERRRTITGYMGQLFKYGRGRMHNILHDPSTFNPLFILPLALILDVSLLILSRNAVFAVPALVYAVVDVLSSANKAYHERDVTSFPALLILYPLAHFSYGVGFVYQMFKNESTR